MSTITPEKALRNAVDIASGAKKGQGLNKDLAALLGVEPMTVSQWFKRGVPAGRCVQIEKLTGVKRHHLRPDLFGR